MLPLVPITVEAVHTDQEAHMKRKLGGSGPEANSMDKAHSDMMNNRSRQIEETKQSQGATGRGTASSGTRARAKAKRR